MFLNILMSGVVLGVLVVISTLFNLYIDGRDAGDGFDGETAVWVALGNLYTIVIGIGGLTAAWYDQLIQASNNWQMSGQVIAIAFVAFVASGLPMMFGDATRTKRRRLGLDR